MNIVFDLGGVVFNWRPDVIIESVFDDPDSQRLVREHIFQHPDWIALDRGTLPLESAIERGAQRTAFPEQDIARLLQAVPPLLTPIAATFSLIRDLHKTANRLYVLSNMHSASINYLEQQYDIWGLFDGVVISSRIQMVKPELQIYEHLLGQHQLRPADTIFIDDMPENLAAAATLGIRTIRFVDTAQCRQALGDLL